MTPINIPFFFCPLPLLKSLLYIWICILKINLKIDVKYTVVEITEIKYLWDVGITDSYLL